jgi:hypothetical protein
MPPESGDSCGSPRDAPGSGFVIPEGLARTLAPLGRDSYLSSKFIAVSRLPPGLTIYSQVGRCRSR